MKKEYKKPNICAVFFDVLDLIHTSDGEYAGGFDGGDDWGDLEPDDTDFITTGF